MKILLAVDGSHSSNYAVSTLLTNLAWFRETPQVDLVYVQRSVHAGTASPLVPPEMDFPQHVYGHDPEEALRDVINRLDEAKVSCKFHLLEGEAAEMICSFAREQGSDLIYIGTRGMGALGNLLLGSTATKVLHKAIVPVMLVSDRHVVTDEQTRRAGRGESADLPPQGSYLPRVSG
jgi:nucleotide-binding universal stress UspA family protein